jgi:hypothetical protein
VQPLRRRAVMNVHHHAHPTGGDMVRRSPHATGASHRPPPQLGVATAQCWLSTPAGRRALTVAPPAAYERVITE